MDDRRIEERQSEGKAGRELRECCHCYATGTVVEFVYYDNETGELTQQVFDCFVCYGSGNVSVHLYPTPRRRR